MRFALAVLAAVLALALISSSSTLAAEGATKTGVIKSADAKAKTFVVTFPARPLTFTVNDKTVIKLDDKESHLRGRDQAGSQGRCDLRQGRRRPGCVRGEGHLREGVSPSSAHWR